MWCIAYFLASTSHANPVPQLTTMLKGLFSGWVSSVINEKANTYLRDAQNRDKPDKAPPPPTHTHTTHQSKIHKERIGIAPSVARSAHYRQTMNAMASGVQYIIPCTSLRCIIARAGQT